MMPGGWWLAVGVGFWLAAGSEARAQGRIPRARINRPSSNSASQRLGLLGGLYTRGNRSVLRTTSSTGPGRPTQGVFRPFRFRMGTGNMRLPALARPGTSSAQNMRIRTPFAMIRGQRASTGRIAGVSGLNTATRLDVPIGGWVSRDVIRLNIRTPAYARPSEQTEFQALIGLRPPPPPVARASRKIESLGLALKQETERRLKTTFERAADAFKAGTAAECEDRAQKIGRALRLFYVVRDIDLEGFIAPLLIAHTALEREQTTFAARSIIQAVRRHPMLFREGFDVGQYYGDRERLEDQMRLYVRSGERNPKSVEAHVLSAYCAWVLGDAGRARAALAEAERVSRGEPYFGTIRAYRAALESGLP